MSLFTSWHLMPTSNTDPVVTPEVFAQSVVEDYALSPNYHAVITKSIQDQLSDFRAHSGLFDLDADVPMPVVDLNEKEAEPTAGTLGAGDDEGARWWARWRSRVGRAARGRTKARERSKRARKRRRVEGDDEGVEGDVEEDDDAWDKGKKLDEMEVDEAKLQEEMRILIRVCCFFFLY